MHVEALMSTKHINYKLNNAVIKTYLSLKEFNVTLTDNPEFLGWVTNHDVDNWDCLFKSEEESFLKDECYDPSGEPKVQLEDDLYNRLVSPQDASAVTLDLEGLGVALQDLYYARGMYGLEDMKVASEMMAPSFETCKDLDQDKIKEMWFDIVDDSTEALNWENVKPFYARVDMWLNKMYKEIA